MAEKAQSSGHRAQGKPQRRPKALKFPGVIYKTVEIKVKNLRH